MTYLYPDAVIQIFCKAPVPGKVKTRLMPELSAEQAAYVHEQLSIRTLQMALQSNLCAVQFWCSPDLSHPFFRQMQALYHLTLMQQSSGDLGQRMHTAICSGNESYQHIILLGCDCPSLNNDDLDLAIHALTDNYDSVLAPAEDGGYCLIGMNKPHSKLFEDISWGSDKVLQQTRNKLRALSLNTLEMETQWDVDNHADYLRYKELST